MSEDKRNDFNDFFAPKRDEDRKDRHEEDNYFYYTYESDSRPRVNQEPVEREQAEEALVPASESAEPKAVRPIEASAPGTRGVWAYPQKPRGGFRRAFATFLAGAVIMGGLMFGADRADLFTAGEQTVSGTEAGSASGALAQSGSDDAGTTTAALDVVRPNHISAIVEQTSAAIVKIETFQKASNQRRSGSLFGDSFFDDFFGDQFNQGETGQDSDQLIQAGMGSGFIFDKAGYVLTNEHVVADSDLIKVVVEGYDEPLEAELLGSTYDLDLAVLKIKSNDTFQTLPLGDDESTKVGDWVVAVGNPYGFDHTVTVGVLSAKERPINIPDGTQTRSYKNLLQTDASINPGNSGGPLLNLKGEVIGINTAVSAQAQGIGFAIPTSTVASVLENLKNDQSIPKPYVGIYMTNIEESWLTELKLESTDGVLVQSIIQGSPAERAGLQPYDVIVKFNDNAVKNVEQFSDVVSKSKIGDKVTLTLVRNGQMVTAAVMIGNQNK